MFRGPYLFMSIATKQPSPVEWEKESISPPVLLI